MMPKRNVRINNRSWKNAGVWEINDVDGMPFVPRNYSNYSEHDDRVNDNIRKVSILSKSRISKHQGGRKSGDGPMHARLGDDDVEMVGAALAAAKINRFKGGPGPSGNMRDRRGGNRRGSSGRHVQIAGGPGQLLPMDAARWHKVVLPFGAKYEKSYLLSVIMSYISPVEFIPYYYRVGSRDSTFYVDDGKVAGTLSRAHQKITVTDGFKLGIRTAPGCPNMPIDERIKPKLLSALQGRFNQATNALDLTCLRSDPNLVDNFILTMFRPVVLGAVVELVLKHLPQLVGLNLTNNQLHTLESLEPLVKRAPELKVLHLGNNKIRDVRKLDCLKGLKLEELFLDGNPLCDKFTKEEVYVSEIRKRFPNVVRLDGAALAAPIKFDVTEEIRLPPSLLSYIVSTEAEAIARQFLEQYFLIYDSDNRQPLIDAYNENATFSLTVLLPKSDTNHRLGAYLQESRNLLRVRDPHRFISTGKAAVVAKLAQLPSTKHDLSTFKVDLPTYNAQMLFLSISGLFTEPKLNHVPVRHFTRNFIIIPLGTGFVIVNDLLFVTNATEKQLKPPVRKPETMATSVPTVISSPITPHMATPVASPVVSPVVPDEMKQQMVMAMCQQTSMNALWSRKCLEENQWNFTAAVQVFSQLHAEHKVPQEAFQQ